MADEEKPGDDATQETKVGNKVVDPHGDTSESPALGGSYAAGAREGDGETSEGSGGTAETKVGTPVVSSSEGEQSPADAQRAGEGKPQSPPPAALQGAPKEDAPEGTGPGGEVRGGYGLGATGPGGATDVRGPSDTGSAGGGQSPADAQRKGDESAQDAFADKPQLFVAGAFVGGFVVAQILKRLGGDN